MSTIEPNYAGSVRFEKVETTKNFQLAKHYKITKLPTLLLFRGAEQVGLLVNLGLLANLLIHGALACAASGCQDAREAVHTMLRGQPGASGAAPDTLLFALPTGRPGGGGAVGTGSGPSPALQAAAALSLEGRARAPAQSPRSKRKIVETRSPAPATLE